MQHDSDLTTFVAAVQFGSNDNDLVVLLSTNNAPLTVFAPTNEAWDALAVEVTGNPNAVGTDLFIPANQAFIRSIVQFHILNTTVHSTEFAFGFPVVTVEGSVFKINSGTPLTITDGRNRTADIVQVDINVDNGVVHKVDRVLLPPNMNLAQTLQAMSTSSGDFTIFIQAVSVAQLTGALGTTTTFTLFVPTDAAFESMLGQLGMTLPDLFANPDQLAAILKFNTIPGAVFVAALPINTPIVTVQGQAFVVDQNLVITDARGRTVHIVKTDVITSNGVIQVTDGVLLPAP
jgi:uncharacterized surface protein with fasciclin (FAS1) repeats